MSRFTDFFRSNPPTLAQQATEHASIGSLLEKYELVSVERNDGDPFVVVADRAPKQLADTNMKHYSREMVDLHEIGSASASPFTSWSRAEYNSALRGLNGLMTYDKMRKSDGVVRGTLRAGKTPVLAARWFIKPGSDSEKDKEVAEFVWNCLTKYMSISWPQLLTEALLMCDFGYYMFEKVWESRTIEGKERMVLKKLAPRHPMDVVEGGWKYDANGGPAGVEMFPANPVELNKYIPISKLLVFSFDKEAGNIEGISILRSAYKHWYYKEQLYKIDAIQKERHGIGIPVIKLPPGFTNTDKALADQLGRNLRTNERAHVVLPPLWDLMFAELKGQPVDSLKSAEAHNEAIRENIMAAFLGKGTTTKQEDQTMFLKATRFIADVVIDQFNHYLIPELVGYNYSTGVNLPTLQARRIGEQEDWRTMSFAIRNYVGAKVIRADDKLEEYIRNEMDLPMADPVTARMLDEIRQQIQIQGELTGDLDNPGNAPVPAAGGKQGSGSDANGNPQAPKAGLPRQTKPSATSPKGNGGRDGNGKS